MKDNSLEIVISRHFNAPREAVFAEWLEAEALKDWFTPQTYRSISAEADARVGGKWQVEYQSPEGQRIREHGIYKAIEPFERLILTLTQSVGPDAPETTIVVTLEVATGGGTLLHFRQTGFDSVAHRDGNAEGWLGCFDKLAARIPTPNRNTT
jgi:uncharacterized protein YndB with AHSA1/START domain